MKEQLSEDNQNLIDNTEKMKTKYENEIHEMLENEREERKSKKMNRFLRKLF
jgi:intergrase/recombinase